MMVLLLGATMLAAVGRAQASPQAGTKGALPLPQIRLTTAFVFSAEASQEPQQTKPPSEGKQPKRILWIIPNYRAVSAHTYLPPLSFTQQFWLATEDTFDYSNFILVGMLSGQSMAANSQPSFGQSWSGYGKYYWHSFADGVLENSMVEAVAPSLTKEDPRYYTLGEGGSFKRTGYVITRTDGGNNTFNFSEIAEAAAAAAINSYYPAASDSWVKTYQRWGTPAGPGRRVQHIQTVLAGHQQTRISRTILICADFEDSTGSSSPLRA